MEPNHTTVEVADSMKLKRTTVRVADPQDDEKMAFLIRNSHKPFAESFGITPENCPFHPSFCQTAWIAEEMKRGVSFYFQLDKGIAAGCVALEPSENGEFYFDRLSVLPARKNRGFRKNMLNHVIEEVRNRGGKIIRTSIIADDLQLKEWFLEFGFVENETKSVDQLPFQVTYLSLAVD